MPTFYPQGNPTLQPGNYAVPAANFDYYQNNPTQFGWEGFSNGAVNLGQVHPYHLQMQPPMAPVHQEQQPYYNVSIAPQSLAYSADQYF